MESIMAVYEFDELGCVCGELENDINASWLKQSNITSKLQHHDR